MKKKGIVIVLAMLLALCIGVGATLAFITVETQSIKNTFTYGDINITLTETNADADDKLNENSYKMVPGNKIAKDPKVTVAEESEDCWLFVKIEKSDNYGTYLENYAVADGWEALTDVDGVYYREAKAKDEFYVLKGEGDGEYANGYVQVSTSVTKTQMEAIKTSGMPTLTFTAYAVQKANVGSAAEAWAIAENGGAPVTP